MRKKIILAIVYMMIVSSFVNIISNTSVAAEPTFSEETPADGAVNISINTPQVSVRIADLHDEINWTIEGQYLASAGSNNTNDGTKTTSFILPLPYSTNIIWYVNATDADGQTPTHKATYNFMTRAKYTPDVPSGFTASVVSKSRIDLTWTKADKADRTYIERNTSSSWSRGEGIDVYNGTAASYQDDGLSESVRYYYQAWSWNETDTVFSTTYASDDDMTANQRPVFSVVTPADDATDIGMNVSHVSVLIQDFDGDLFNWTIEGYYVTSAGSNGASGGTKTANLILPLPYSTNIIWYVNATDGYGWKRAEYNFDTRDEYIPGTPSGFTASVVSKSRIDLTWTKADKADRTYIERNTSSSWSRGEGIDVYNGTAASYQDDGLSESVRYYYQAWSWNETDTVFSNTYASDNDITANQRPVFSVVTPADDATDIGINVSHVSVLIQDFDGDLFNWTIEGYYVTSAGSNGASGGTKTANLILPLPYSTNIIWYVNATDGYGWKRAVYNFITRPNLPPVFSVVTPANNSKNIGISTPSVSVYIQDVDADRFNWTIQGKYVTSTSGTNAGNGTKTATLLTPLPKDTKIKWFVNATDPSGSDEWTSATYYFNTTATTLPTLKYTRNPGVGLSAVGPIATDVNNDGKIEIIRSGPDGIAVLDGATGSTVWNKTVKMWNDHCPMEAIDLDNDGILEIITSHELGTWALHGNNGSVYWYNPNALLQNKYCVAGDINADGYPEVYVCGIGSVTALTHDGHIFAQNWTYYPCFGGLALGDTDYDGVFELYQGDRSESYPEYPSGGRGCQSYWASNLTLRWSHPEVLCSSQCPTLIDVDKDGKLDVVICSQSGGGFCVYNSTNGAIIHQTTAYPGIKTHSQAPIYDIDGDGNLEIIACREWSKPVVWDLFSWQVDAWLPWDCWEPPAIADINGDGYVEIIACEKTNISIFNHDYQLMGNISLTCPDNWGMSMIVAQDVDADGLLELIFNRISTVYVYNTVGPAPDPRALSQFNFYSQHRGRAPYYVEYEPKAPIVNHEYPTNESTNIQYNPQLSVHVFDYQYNTMTITIRTNASTGIWHTIQTYSNKHEGTYTANTTGMNLPQKYYWWRVTVTDSTGNTTSKLYKFRTVDTMILSNITPTDSAINIQPNPKLSIDVQQRAGLPMTIQFLTNTSGSWVVIGTNTSVSNGTYSQKPTTMSSYNKKYYWSVHCYDGHYWVNDSYRFTTRSGGGGGGGGSSDGSENTKPVADASAGEPYQGFVNTEITFDGSKSHDSDGNITTWSWNFGDGTTGFGKTIQHVYSTTGTYTVQLTVTDDNGATNTDTTTCIIQQQQNRPPSQPIITGPTSGTKNTLYIYTAVSTDADNDTLQYTFTWSGSESQVSSFLPNATSYPVSHSWAAAGRYNVTVTVTDNHNASSSKITVYIDAVQTGDIGYLLDNNGDGIYDAFYSEESKQTITIQKKDGSYLIDSNGDGVWDHTYNTTSGQTSSYQEKKNQPGFELVFVLCATAVAIILWRKKRRV